LTDSGDQQRATPRATDRLLQRVIQNVKDCAIIALEPDLRIASWNAGAERILGWERDEILGQPVDVFFTPEDRATGVPGREVDAALREGEAMDERWHLRKDATRFWASGVLAAVRDEQGALQGFAKILTDQTERQLAREGAEHAKSVAEAANRSKDEFLATVSHELRTPLNSIVGWAHLLKQRAVEGATADKALDTIIRNAQIQTRLINDLLDMSRIISGQLRLDIQECELIPVIDAALETLRPAAEAKQIRVESDLDPDAEPILGDPARMQQVVWNLVSNAIKFTPTGGSVRVQLQRADRHVCIVVCDTGPGIAPDVLPFIFDRQKQAWKGSTQRQGGLGLGLSIVRHIVELHGGIVEARGGREGQGAELVVTVPWWNPKELRPAAESPDGATPIDLQGMRVLLVEDEADPRELVTVMLRAFNAQVHAVATADEALAAITTSPPDVLVADIRMDNVDGYALIRDVRSLPPERGGRIPAIALTALTRQEDHRRALDAGYQVHVPKPVTPAKLVAVLGFLLRQQHRT
jgi:PAS domain S-box-containing protein